MPFKPGYINGIAWTPTGGSPTTLCDFRHSHSESDEGHEVTSSCHNGIQAFIASILRGEGTASFHITTASQPWSLGIVAQATGTFSCMYGSQSVFTIPAFISRVNYQNETAAGTDYDVTWKLSAESGTYSRPSP